jgi:hypothetical protein
MLEEMFGLHIKFSCMMLKPGVFNMAFYYVKRFNHRNRLSVMAMRCREYVMIVIVIIIYEWTFEVITVNDLRVGEGDNSSTNTPVMIYFHTASVASYSTVIQYYSLK